MSIELKIKANSLAAETKIIRSIEKKLKKRYLKVQSFINSEPDGLRVEYHFQHTNKITKLHNHRTEVVRKAARATHLARMYIKGMPYYCVEELAYESPRYDAIAKLVKTYGGEKFHNVTAKAIEEWTWVGNKANFDRWSWSARPPLDKPKKVHIRPSNLEVVQR